MPKHKGWQEITLAPAGRVRLSQGPDGTWLLEFARPRATIVLPAEEAAALHAQMDEVAALSPRRDPRSA